jgi:hypothetical protein
MNNYNDFYLEIEAQIDELNQELFEAEQTLKGQARCRQIQSILARKDVVINKAFESLQVPQHLQDRFRDELFTDAEFDHLCNAVVAV